MCSRKSLYMFYSQCSETDPLNLSSCPLASRPQLLAFLLKSKSCLTSNRIFQLVLYLSSSVNLSSGSTYIQNPAAFQALLCDLEVNTSVVQLQEVDDFPTGCAVVVNDHPTFLSHGVIRSGRTHLMVWTSLC